MSVPRCVDCGLPMFTARKNRKRCNTCRAIDTARRKNADKRRASRERRIALDKLYWGPSK